jgi:GNAT superfamily N-acetyltransferase
MGGRSRHYVLVPANDPELLEAWYRLGFGQQQAYGIREVPTKPWPDGVRHAQAGDVEGLLALLPLIARHQAGSPVFSDHAARQAERPEERIDDVRTEIEGDIASDEIGTLVAEVDGRLVGLFEVTPVELAGEAGHGTLARPERTCFLAFAATVPEVRGAGVGLRLTDAAFAWAHEAGYSTMVTDWRVTNLLSSRFWPRRGFRLTFLRVYRSIP